MTPEVGADAQALFLEGWALHQKGDLAGAEARYRAVLERLPQHVHALQGCGIVASQRGDFTAALGWFDKTIAADPGNDLAHFNRGLAAEKLSRSADAHASFAAAIALKPDYVDAYHHRGLVAMALAQYADAIRDFDATLKANPNLTDVWVERGIAFWRLADLTQALDSYDRALALRPDLVAAHINRGVVLRELQRFPEALASLDEAIRLSPTHGGAYNNRGTVLLALGDPVAALASFEVAVHLQPDNINALNNRGVAMDVLRRSEAAVAIFDTILRLNPNYTEAHFNRGNALKSLLRFEEAVVDFQKAVDLGDKRAFLVGTLAHTKKMVCDWSSFDADVAAMTDGLLRGEKIAPPHEVVAAIDSSLLQRRAAEIWDQHTRDSDGASPAFLSRARCGKVRVGYFSPDFRNHPVAYLTAELFERHDRARFDITAFSLDTPGEDAMRARLRATFDRFLEVATKSDAQIVALARELEIDIAVDLTGYTANGRAGIFARRAAPVQVGYLGFPGTMGADFMDYIVADSIVIPPASAQYYVEKVIYLPCFQPNDTARAIAPTPSRAAMGLPEKGVVFCCFNQPYKLNPVVFDSWVRILKQVEDSVLWFSGLNAAAMRNLQAEAVRRGVDPGRLIFASRVPTAAEHLARQRCADLFLDALPYNAHTTASDALWVGLPVLTCIGESYAARVAASLLTAIGMPELTTTTREDYEAMAVDLARAPQKIAALKDKLARNRLTTPLFDIEMLTRKLEDAYRQIHGRARDGLPPAHITAV